MFKGDITVNVGDLGNCNITTVVDNQIECFLGANKAGPNSLTVYRNSYGNSNSDVSYTFDLLVTSISHTEGNHYYFMPMIASIEYLNINLNDM